MNVQMILPDTAVLWFSMEPAEFQLLQKSQGSVVEFLKAKIIVVSTELSFDLRAQSGRPKPVVASAVIHAHYAQVGEKIQIGPTFR